MTDDLITPDQPSRKRNLGWYVVAAIAVALLVVFISQRGSSDSFPADHGLERMVDWAGEGHRAYYECVVASIDSAPGGWRLGSEYELIPPNSDDLLDWYMIRGSSRSVTARYAEGAVEFAGFRTSRELLTCNDS